jgi:hypothetical protein
MAASGHADGGGHAAEARTDYDYFFAHTLFSCCVTDSVFVF